MNTLVKILDQDGVNKVKTSLLRSKIESNQSQNVSTNPSPMGMYPDYNNNNMSQQ